jgi:uncharacterized protein with NAD-binding domain and iron-sulfur cluster
MMPKKKIAILGGGLGSMTTAFWLTNQPGWQDQYDITVYQVGWRLGGKGAAGRGDNGEILEHGLHIWIGFYDNAFRMIQAAYQELGRAPGTPLATWLEAFTRQDYVAISELVNGEWSTWPWDFPTNPRMPGDKGEYLSIWDYFYEAVQIGVKQILIHVGVHPELQVKPELPEEVWAKFGGIAGGILDDIGVFGMGILLHEVMKLTGKHCDAAQAGQVSDYSDLAELLGYVQKWVQGRKSVAQSDPVRRFLILADAGIAIAKGILADIIPDEVHGFDKIDAMDFREWMIANGSNQDAANSAPVKALYDLVFGYENGESEKPNFGAGAALLSSLRIGMDYKGSIFWKMNAGMGDTIFGPLYLVLKQRGVRFEFFSRVENLGLSADKTQIETITIGQQVTLKNEYDPFITVKDLPCWPIQPNYDQIVEGEQLQAEGINLESFWTPWKNVATKDLKLGVDFDQVVLGISIGSFPYICPELIAANDRWKAMCANVQTVATMSMQWWMKPSLQELGWTLPSPVMDGYVDPMNTWADMSFLLPMENWTGDQKPLNLSYFCGAMVGGIADPSDPTVPATALAQVKQVGLDFANQNTGFLWPRASAPGYPNGIDFDNFFGGFDGQYFRANIDPSERYVLSLKGSVYSRIKPNESGFTNLFLTGDWTYNYFNAGCVEATVISGMLCTNAMTGAPTIDSIEGVRPGKWWT